MKMIGVIQNIFPADFRIRHGRNSLFCVGVPFTPVSQAPQFHISDKIILITIFCQGLHRKTMTLTKIRIFVIRGIPFSIIRIIIFSVTSFLIQPVWNIPMSFFSRNITEKSQYSVFVLLFPLGNMIPLFQYVYTILPRRRSHISQVRPI